MSETTSVFGGARSVDSESCGRVSCVAGFRPCKIIRLGLCFGALLGAAEWASREFDRRLGDPEPSLPPSEVFNSHPVWGRTLRAGVTASCGRQQFSVNRWGFRGVEVPEDKPEGTVRIVAIGDSTTTALDEIDDESVWVARMRHALNETHEGSEIDAINASVPGYALRTCTQYLEERVARFDPDFVVAWSVANSVARHAWRQFRGSGAPWKGQEDTSLFFVERSSLAPRVIHVAEQFHDRWLPRLRHDRLDERGIQKYVRRLSILEALCRERGWRLILCTAPRSFGDLSAPSDQRVLAATAMDGVQSLSLVGINDAYERYNEAIRLFAARHDTPLVDLDRIVPKRAAYFLDSLHLNPRGHRMVGDAVAEVIRADQRMKRGRGRAP